MTTRILTTLVVATIRLVLLFFFVGHWAESTVQAQIILPFDWNNPSGGSYSNQFNWTSVFGGIPDATSELARFKLGATYTVSVDADYTVSSLAAREQGSPTLSFPFSSFVPRKIFSATNLSVDPTVGRTVSLDLVNGDVRVSGSTNVGSSTADGQANLFVNSLLTTAAANVGLGANTTANVTVGHVSRWTGSGPLVLGGLGDAHLELQSDLHRSCAIICGPYTAARATATHAGVTMADGIGSNATASIRGVWSTGDLVVGNRGTAVVDLLATLVTPPFGVSIASAAEVTSNIVTVGVEPGSSGTVRVDGSFVTGFPNFVTSSSTWNVLGSLVLGGNGSVAGGTGRLSIGSSNTVTVNELFLMWQGGTLTLSGGGQLNVSGSAVLDGVLEFSATNLQAGNVFQVVSASGGVTGRFDQLNLPALNPGLSWDIDYNATNVTLTVVSNSVPGDYNNNGVADAADYTVWRDNRGGSVTLPNDTTPGTVTAADYDVWKSQFGGSSSLAAMTVPEPCSATWVWLALACTVRTRFEKGQAVGKGLRS